MRSCSSTSQSTRHNPIPHVNSLYPSTLPHPCTVPNQIHLRNRVRQLTKQRDQLRAELQSKRHPLSTSAAILSQHVIDLQSINQSDGVFQREELQEEAKVLYQEWKRLQDFNFQQRIAISNAQKELAELLRDEAVARFERQKGQISELQEKVKQYQHENAKLDRRVKELARIGG